VIDSVLKQLDLKGNISTRIKQCSAYADDILITTRTSHSLVATFQKLKETSAQVGLNINKQKTKYLRCMKKQHIMSGIYISQTHPEQVKSFKYLGSIVNGNNSIEEEIKERISTGNKDYYVEYFLLGITPASELSESTFRNLVSVPSSWTISVGVNVVSVKGLIYWDGSEVDQRASQ
jgi:hypothetical protein